MFTRKYGAILMVSFLLAASFAVSAPPGKAAVEDDAKLLNIALSYVADNDWDMALYVLDKIKNESSDPQLKLKATVWKVVVLRSLGDRLRNHFQGPGKGAAHGEFLQHEQAIQGLSA